MDEAQDSLHFLRTRTVSDLVQEEILKMIKTGEISAGEKLNEMTFSKRLQVSRAPIREAFRALEEAGLVRLEKNRGVFVREISGREARELYDLRATLDEAAGRELAPRITDAQLKELQDWLSRLEAAAKSQDSRAYFPMNIAFHDRIVEMTGNVTLTAFYRRLIDSMHLLRRRSIITLEGNSASRAEHRKIVTALGSRSADVAGPVLRKHVENGYKRFLSVVR